MPQIDWMMPEVMKEMHHLPFDYLDGEGIDFEPFLEFQSEEETRIWIQAWTGNKLLDGAEYRVFGQDGSGGYAAFWLVRPEITLLDQPIVFFGSEGDLGILACTFADYLWLLAGGLGPFEAINYEDAITAANPVFTTFAINYAAANKAMPQEILAKAQSAFPTFKADIQALCGY